MLFGRLLVAVALGSALMGPAFRDGGELDGFTIGHVPARAGERVSDFRYEWEDVRFASRVWERESEDVSHVDLKIAILRGSSLATLPALRAFLAEYHEHDPESWHLDEFQNGSYPGYINDSEAFWLTSAGVAVSVRIPSGALTSDDLRTTALSIRPT